jgi:hypothetical protein
MPIKHVAYRNQMVKLSSKKQALGWTSSTIMAIDLAKTKEEGFVAASAEITFPSTEVVPQSQSGYRVMFLAFLLHKFSLSTHEFLCGLVFVYGVQLHQLTLNSILHIARFITLGEALQGINLTRACGSACFVFAAMCPRKKFMTLAAPLCLFGQKLNI